MKIHPAHILLRLLFKCDLLQIKLDSVGEMFKGDWVLQSGCHEGYVLRRNSEREAMTKFEFRAQFI